MNCLLVPDGNGSQHMYLGLKAIGAQLHYFPSHSAAAKATEATETGGGGGDESLQEQVCM